MKRLIYAASSSNMTQYVNKIGKYLKKNIDGAFKIQFAPNECEILMRMYYQLPGEEESFEEMIFMIDIAAYSNKLRVNLTEDTDFEKTIGQIILTDDNLFDMKGIKERILSRIKDFIQTEYEDYDFVY